MCLSAGQGHDTQIKRPAAQPLGIEEMTKGFIRPHQLRGNDKERSVRTKCGLVAVTRIERVTRGL
jgi:hypothetical protein